MQQGAMASGGNGNGALPVSDNNVSTTNDVMSAPMINWNESDDINVSYNLTFFKQT